MEWVDRVGAMYSFFNGYPPLAHDMGTHGPQSDFAYALAYGLQNTATDLNPYPADSQTLAG